MNPIDLGCKLTFHGNVLYCSLHRSFDQNLRACLVALAYITGAPIEELRADPMLRIERYRSS